MQFLTAKVTTRVCSPDVIVNLNNMSPSMSVTTSDNVRPVVVVVGPPAWRVTSHRYWYAPDPPKAIASQLKGPLPSIWDGPAISNERDGDAGGVD